MCWQCLFFRLHFIHFGTFFGAPNEPKKGLPILGQVLSLVFRASDGCPESFWTPPRGHFGRFGGPFFMILDDQDTISVNFGMHFSRVGRSNDKATAQDATPLFFTHTMLSHWRPFALLHHFGWGVLLFKNWLSSRVMYPSLPAHRRSPK